MTTRNVPITLVDCGCETTVYDDRSGVEIHYCNLHKSAQKMLDALLELAKGKGRFSIDPFEHACNTIADMKDIANDTIRDLI